MRAVSRLVLAFVCGLAAASSSGCQRTVEEACDDLALAECERHEACSLASSRDLGTCQRLVATRCARLPELPGTELDSGDIEACAAAYHGYSCASLFVRAPPIECRFRGNRSNGSACEAGAECQSSVCRPDAEGRCGACAAVRSQNDTCSKAGSPCAAGLYCGEGGRCVPYGVEGEECGALAPCNPLYRCKDGACIARAGEGEPCNGQPDCDVLAGLVCNRVWGVCEARGAAIATDHDAPEVCD